MTKSPVEATLTFPQAMMSVNSVPEENALARGIVMVYCWPYSPVLLRTVRTSFFSRVMVSKSE